MRAGDRAEQTLLPGALQNGESMSDKKLPLTANLGELFKKFPWVVQVTFEALYYDPPVWLHGRWIGWWEL